MDTPGPRGGDVPVPRIQGQVLNKGADAGHGADTRTNAGDHQGDSTNSECARTSDPRAGHGSRGYSAGAGAGLGAYPGTNFWRAHVGVDVPCRVNMPVRQIQWQFISGGDGEKAATIRLKSGLKGALASSSTWENSGESRHMAVKDQVNDSYLEDVKKAFVGWSWRAAHGFGF